MSMTERVYNDIVRLLEPISFNRQPLQLVAKQYPQVPEDTLLSIYSHLVKLHTKRTHWHHRKPKIMEQYYQSYLSAKQEDTSADLLLQMAHKVSLSPAIYARFVLERYAENLPPELLPSPPTPTPAVLVKQWMKNPQSIPDPALQLHVKTCFLNDVNYGPLAENIKWSVGHEYEFLLREKVEELKVPFLDEDGLRARGYDKTPDIKLEVPIAVGGYIVNWIESKASFGDRKSHEKYLKDQFWSYQNRYGSGVVIYWFGFVEELNSFQDQGILLMERFPDTNQITTLHTSLSPSHIGH